MTVSAAIGFAAACLVSLILTPLVRKLALKIGLVDRPDSRRKLHAGPMPLGGGVVVFLAMSVVLGGVLVVRNPWAIGLSKDWHDALAFFISGGFIVALGLVDDRFGLRGRQKLLGQIVAASLLAASGLVIHGLGIFGYYLDLGPFALPVTVLWLVGAINAINLLDGIDGLATTIGIILSVTLAVLAAMTNHPGVATIALVLAGSMLGFLRYNFPPAKIFLGDAGSMLIGPKAESPKPLLYQALTTISENRGAPGGAPPSAVQRHEWPRLAAKPRCPSPWFLAPERV